MDETSRVLFSLWTMSNKTAYTIPIANLSIASKRLQEQIKGRVILCHTEILRSSKTKGMAIIVDNSNKLQGVLVLEAWSDADQMHMKKTILANVGKVITITNAKIANKGRTTVYFDKELKMSFDKDTIVKKAAEDASFPTELPALPDVKHAQSLTEACLISIAVAVHQAGKVTEVTVQGTSKKVCNLQVASGDKAMSAAFWDEELATQMSHATAGEVFRLDYFTLVPEGNGCYKLTSNTASRVELQAGAGAEAVRAGLSDKVDTMSAVYGKSRDDKMKEKFQPVSLIMVSHVKSMDATTGFYTNRNFLVPALYVKDVRSMNADNPNLCYYKGCTTCNKQLISDGLTLKCDVHGVNKGKKVFGVQMMLQDPEHKMEVAVWEEPLQALLAATKQPDPEKENAMELLQEHLRGREMYARFGVGQNKAGKATYLDMYDLSEQVTDTGSFCVYRDVEGDDLQGVIGVPPVCCQSISTNELQQLTVGTMGVTPRVVDQVHLMGVVTGDPAIDVMKDIDGIDVVVTAKCTVCSQEMKLHMAGVPDTVRKFMSTPAGASVDVLVLGKSQDGVLEVMSCKTITSNAAVCEKVFKYQAAQFQKRMKRASRTESSKDYKKDVAKFLEEAQRKSAKRLKLEHTMDGDKL